MKRKHYISIILGISVLILAALVMVGISTEKLDVGDVIPGISAADNEARERAEAEAEAARLAFEEARRSLIDGAKRLALSYDYDGAVAMLESFDDFESDEELLALKEEFLSQKALCVPIDLNTLTHIFYHSLNVDPVLGFSDPDHRPLAVGHNQWMTTVSEFQKITQEMYDRGFVLVDFDEAVAGNVYLPAGKTPFILSLDDLSYYHVYDGYGYATKLVLDERGKVACEYTDVNGNTSVGAYDAVPLLDEFIEAHPDASYKGAKGIIALTGYNGIFGYRTDETYDYNHPSLDREQRRWMDAHPDFNLEEDRAKAKEIAEVLKADGWKFASHTWGHIKTNEVSIDRVIRDNERWMNNVATLVGPTNKLIFAHGAAFAKGGEYDDSNDKYVYYKNQGYNQFFGVDAKANTFRMYENYTYQGRRNIDGYRIYYNANGTQNNLSDLFDPVQILDPARPPVRPL